MAFTVDMQDPLSFRLVWIGLALLLAAAGAFFLWYCLRDRSWMGTRAARAVDPYANLPALKKKYMLLLDELEKRADKGELTLRKAFQTCSLLARSFVEEITGRPVSKSTLTDLKKMKMTPIENLVRVLYEPEFAPRSIGDLKEALKMTREVIRKW